MFLVLLLPVTSFTDWKVASGGNGATTVSATMFFAHKVRAKNILLLLLLLIYLSLIW